MIEEILIDVRTKEQLDNIISLYGLNYQDSQGDSILHELSKKGQISLIAHLFDRSRKQKMDINLKNVKQRTALYQAFDEDTVDILLLHKIDYQSKDLNNQTAMDVNPYVNFIVNQRCNQTKKRLLGMFN